MGLRAYLFSSPMVVEYDYGSLQSPFQALTNGSLQSSISLPSSPISLWEPSIFLPSSSISLQSPQELARTSLKTLLAKMSEMNEMRNRMREKGVNECFNLLPNPRLPFPCFISPKKKKKKHPFYLLTRAFSAGAFFSGSVFFLFILSGTKTKCNNGNN
jgi:hypothetical protein